MAMTTTTGRRTTDNRGPRAIAWVYTLNAEKNKDGTWEPWTDANTKWIPENLITYHVFGKEIAPDTNRPHLQGFVVFKNRTSLSQLKTFNKRVHWEVKAKASSYLQASDYCKKDGDYTEIGQLPENSQAVNRGGAATKERYDELWNKAKSGEIETIDKDLLVKHYHTVKRIRQDYQPKSKDLENVCGEWIVGAPNTGKSYTARAENKDQYFVKPCNKWWDGYQGEAVVILDDFEMDHRCLGHYLKIWADRYAFPAEMKGTTVNLRPQKIVVTSNYTIGQIFGGLPDMISALERRYKVRDFDLNPPLRETVDEVDEEPIPRLPRQDAFMDFCDTVLNSSLAQSIPDTSNPLLDKTLTFSSESDSELSVSQDGKTCDLCETHSDESQESHKKKKRKFLEDDSQ